MKTKKKHKNFLEQIIVLFSYMFFLAVFSFIYYNDYIRYQYFPEISRHTIGFDLLLVLIIGGIITISSLKRGVSKNENSN
jgi:hypothetical protein